eukprot:12889273-Prorocentrum_lima.AAC.1
MDEVTAAQIPRTQMQPKPTTNNGATPSQPLPSIMETDGETMPGDTPAQPSVNAPSQNGAVRAFQTETQTAQDQPLHEKNQGRKGKGS